MSKEADRSVFVGNIPYDAKEEDLKQFFECIGPVVSFRLIRDRDNDKPKGYGFCEFREKEYARSAIRNMNDVEFRGRALRVDYSERHAEKIPHPVTTRDNSLQTALSNLTYQDALLVFGAMQRYAQRNEEELYNIFKARPYLLYALLKLMHRMNSDFTAIRRQRVNTGQGLLPSPDETLFMPPGQFIPRPPPY